jgi:hypothetical protein
MVFATQKLNCKPSCKTPLFLIMHEITRLSYVDTTHVAFVPVRIDRIEPHMAIMRFTCVFY